MRLLTAGLILLLAAVILLPVVNVTISDTDERKGLGCLSNLKSMGSSLLVYMQDYDEHFPAASDWMDAIAPYQKEERAYHCPTVQQTDPSGYGYAFNSLLSRQSIGLLKDPRITPALYDARDLGRNAHAPGRAGLANPPRHAQGQSNNIGYADGHVKALVLFAESGQ